MNNINNNLNPQDIGNMDNRHNGAVNGIRIGDPHNVFHIGNNGMMYRRALDERNVSSKDVLSFEDLKNMELGRKKFDIFITDLKGSNPDAEKRIDFIMNHCAISQAELAKLNEIASKDDAGGKVSRVVTWIGEEGEILSKDGPAKETSGIWGITKAANSFDLCVGARQLESEEFIVYANCIDYDVPNGYVHDNLKEAIDHFNNLGFVIDEEKIFEKIESLSKGKDHGYEIKIRPLMFNTFGVGSDSAITQALKSGVNALLPTDVSGTITKGAEVLQKYLEKEQEKANKDGVILIPYITGHSFGGFNATGIAAINEWGSTMFNPLGIGEGVANARRKNKGRLYRDLVNLNKNSDKHLIFSTINDFTSSDVDPHVGGAIQKGGIFFGRVINVPNKVGTDSTKTLLATHCNYRKNLKRNLRELEEANGSIGWDRDSFEKIFPDADDGTGKNLHKDFVKFGKIKSYPKDKIDELRKKYNQTILKDVAWTSAKIGCIGGTLVAGVALGGIPFVLGSNALCILTTLELVRENLYDAPRKYLRTTVNVVGTTKEKVGDVASAGLNLAKKGGQKALNAVKTGGQKIGKAVKHGLENVLGKKRNRDHNRKYNFILTANKNYRGNQNDVQEDDYNSTADSSISLKEDEDI